MLRVATNLFWFAFLTEGLLGIIDEGLWLSGPFASISILRGVVTVLLLILSMGMTVAVSFTPRVPVRVVLPMLFYTWWVAIGQGVPLNFLNIPLFPFWLALFQIVVAGNLWWRFRQPGAVWYFPFAGREGPAVSVKRVFLVGTPLAVAICLLTLVSLCSELAATVESLSGGYVRIRPDGIYLVERQFESAEGRQVRLAGMMHVARSDFYTGILPSADPEFPSVVLVEGVTDQRRLLGEEGLNYTKVARLFNITSQEESTFTAKVHAGLQDAPQIDIEESASANEGIIHFRHADVDVETFHPKTIAFILAVTGIFHAEDWRQFLAALSDPSSPISDESAQTQVMHDILFARNEKLIAEIDSSLKTYRRVIVPWGALHLSEIESWLKARRFVQYAEVERKALAFW